MKAQLKKSLRFIPFLAFSLIWCCSDNSQLDLDENASISAFNQPLNTGNFSNKIEVNTPRHTDLSFSYTITRNEFDKTRYNIDASIKNNRDNPVYFLSESCNGLDDYLKTNQTNTSIEISLFCEITYPRKIEIIAHDTYHFNSNLRVVGNSPSIRLMLTFIELSGNTEVKDKSLDEVRDKYTLQLIELIGPEVNLP